MKNYFKTITGILILGLLVVSCKKDKNKDQGNYFKINDTTYELAGGTLENYGTDTWYEGYNIDLSLMSEGIDVSVDDEWSGSGKAIYFEMFSTSSTSLPSGSYVFDDTSNPIPTFSFDWSEYCTNWVYGASNTWPDIISGTVTISKSGDTYEITLTGGENIAGDVITAHYKGPLQYFDLNIAKGSKKRHVK